MLVLLISLAVAVAVWALLHLYVAWDNQVTIPKLDFDLKVADLFAEIAKHYTAAAPTMVVASKGLAEAVRHAAVPMQKLADALNGITVAASSHVDDDILYLIDKDGARYDRDPYRFDR